MEEEIQNYLSLLGSITLSQWLGIVPILLTFTGGIVWLTLWFFDYRQKHKHHEEILNRENKKFEKDGSLELREDLQKYKEVIDEFESEYNNRINKGRSNKNLTFGSHRSKYEKLKGKFIEQASPEIIKKIESLHSLLIKMNETFANGNSLDIRDVPARKKLALKQLNEASELFEQIKI